MNPAKSSIGIVMNQPGSWCLAEEGRQVRSQGPCRVSWPQPGALAAAEVAVAVAQAVPGRWGLAGAEHLHKIPVNSQTAVIALIITKSY